MKQLNFKLEVARTNYQIFCRLCWGRLVLCGDVIDENQRGRKYSRKSCGKYCFRVTVCEFGVLSQPNNVGLFHFICIVSMWLEEYERRKMFWTKWIRIFPVTTHYRTHHVPVQLCWRYWCLNFELFK